MIYDTMVSVKTKKVSARLSNGRPEMSALAAFAGRIGLLFFVFTNGETSFAPGAFCAAIHHQKNPFAQLFAARVFARAQIN